VRAASFLFLCALVASLATRAHAQSPIPPAPQASTTPATANATAPPDASISERIQGIEQRVELRTIDRASVRIVCIAGARTFVFDSRETRVRRAVAQPESSFGTGVFVDPSGILLTAAHVIRGADLVSVILTGSDAPRPARVVYVDAEHDLAFLHVQATPPAYVTLPRQARRLRIGERVFGTGFPLDVRERFPAAFAGILARENNDGSLQAAISLNPGNSGGPVVDEHDELIGVVSRRGEPTRGVEGIALLEPVRFVLPGFERAKRAIADRTPAYRREDEVIVRILADFARTTDERPIFENTTIPTLDQAATSPGTAEGKAIVAAHAWNMMIALLEHRSAREVSGLPQADQALGTRLRTTSRTLAEQALQEAPYLLVRYPVLRVIVLSGDRSYVLRETPQRESTSR
jgi:S1-C subfamily serine protease